MKSKIVLFILLICVAACRSKKRDERSPLDTTTPTAAPPQGILTTPPAVSSAPEPVDRKILWEEEDRPVPQRSFVHTVEVLEGKCLRLVKVCRGKITSADTIIRGSKRLILAPSCTKDRSDFKNATIVRYWYITGMNEKGDISLDIHSDVPGMDMESKEVTELLLKPRCNTEKVDLGLQIKR